MIKNNKEIYGGSQAKTIVKKSSWYFMVSIYTKVVSFLVATLIVTNYLSPAEFGVLTNIETIANFLAIFISLGLDEAYFRFIYNHNETKDKIKEFVSSYFWIIILFGIVVAVISSVIMKYTFAARFKLGFHPFISLTVVGALLLQLSALGNSFLRQQLKTELLSITIFLSYNVYVILNIVLLVVFRMGIQAQIYALFAQNVVLFVIFVFILLKYELIGFKFNFKIIVEGLVYSIPLLPNQLSFWIANLSDKLLLIYLRSESESGIYSVGYKIASMITVFSTAVFTVYKPMMFSMFSDDKEAARKKITHFIPIYYFVIFWLAFALGFLSKETIMIFIHNAKYHPAHIVVPIVASGYLFMSMYKPFYNIITYYGKTWVISAGAIIQAAVNLVLNIILIPRFGSIAAAWTTVFSFFFSYVWLYVFSQRLFSIKLDYKKLVIITMSGVIVLCAWYGIDGLIHSTNNFVNFGIKSVLMFAGAGSLILTGQINIKEILLKNGAK